MAKDGSDLLTLLHLVEVWVPFVLAEGLAKHEINTPEVLRRPVVNDETWGFFDVAKEVRFVVYVHLHQFYLRLAHSGIQLLLERFEMRLQLVTPMTPLLIHHNNSKCLLLEQLGHLSPVDPPDALVAAPLPAICLQVRLQLILEPFLNKLTQILAVCAAAVGKLEVEDKVFLGKVGLLQVDITVNRLDLVDVVAAFIEQIAVPD